jgi:hypothetical protein
MPPMPIEGLLPGPNGQPTGPAVVPEPPFGYSVSGVIVGQHPAAVFTDAQGNQRLVQLGGSLDAETKVIGIEKGKVTVKHGSKTLRFEMGGNPNGK